MSQKKLVDAAGGGSLAVNAILSVVIRAALSDDAKDTAKMFTEAVEAEFACNVAQLS